MVTIEGRVVGRRKPLFADWSLEPPRESRADDGSVTLREFIGRVVRAEAAAFDRRQAERAFVHALTAREIAAGAEAGKIHSGGSDVPHQTVDVERSVAVALQAFEDGLYLVVIDGREVRDLEAQVFVRQESRVTFLRLTLLAGG